jgi:hypothetical protein
MPSIGGRTNHERRPRDEDPIPAAHCRPSALPEKDPEDWVTGDEPMTGPQASYLKTLSQEANEEFDETLSKADASKRIEELQAKTGRGK